MPFEQRPSIQFVTLVCGAGDCLAEGRDPPTMVTVVADDSTWLAPPTGFHLLWHDESVTQDRALTLWLPAPSAG